jgi:hypothetical protein
MYVTIPICPPACPSIHPSIHPFIRPHCILDFNNGQKSANTKVCFRKETVENITWLIYARKTDYLAENVNFHHHDAMEKTPIRSTDRMQENVTTLWIHKLVPLL